MDDPLFHANFEATKAFAVGQANQAGGDAEKGMLVASNLLYWAVELYKICAGQAATAAILYNRADALAGEMSGGEKRSG